MTTTCLACKHFCCTDEQLHEHKVLVACCDKKGADIIYLKDFNPCKSFKKEEG